MNDFLRACNCEHPTEEDCEKCIGEALPKTKRPGGPVPEAPAPADKKSSAPADAKGRKTN